MDALMDNPPNFLPDMLRQPAEAVRHLQDALLRRMVEICYDAHPYYAQLMRREGLEPRHIQSCADLVRLPPASKTEFLADPDAFRLDPDKLRGHEGTLWKVVYTTGTTTGPPCPGLCHRARSFRLHVRLQGPPGHHRPCAIPTG